MVTEGGGMNKISSFGFAYLHGTEVEGMRESTGVGWRHFILLADIEVN